MSTSETIASVQGREIVVTRLFRAPRDLVYRTWTDPDHLPKWWGPKGFAITVQEIDVRPGGVWRYVMHGPDGTDYDNLITYVEIDEPERIVYSHGDAAEPEQFRVTVTFAERDGGTELTMTSQFKSVEALQYVVKEYGAVEGAKSTMERLGEHLANL